LKIQHDHNQLSDLQLIALYKERNDVSVVGTLFSKYKHLVYGVCLKYLKDEDESKDALMQIFEKLLTDLKKHNIEYFKAWLHTVSKNHCLMLLRTRKSRGYEQTDSFENSAEVVEMNTLWHPDNAQEKEASLQQLEQAIQQLNDEQKKCIELFYLEEKSYQQVSEITGYSMLQVKSFIQNGKRNLKILLEKKYAG
jgi:RNA polymerase sigma factor (sigma-70 family)